MAVSSNRQIAISFTGDIQGNDTYAAAANATSPGQTQPVRLSAGNNTITIPGAGTVPTAVTIVPPSGNTSIITAKGVNGDTGIPLHLTDPSSIALHSTATLVLNAVTQVDVRLVWT